ncbi:MAG: hypothetical protein R3Y24_00570 [Eubacteriales bacterium]
MNKTHMSLGEDSPEIITLFLSFDIVNSTYYKSLDKEQWSLTISKIIRYIISAFSNNPTGDYEFWKTLGDEVIYTRKIHSVQDLLDTLEEIYRTMILLNQKISQGELFDGTATQMLSIKAATWLADLSSSHERSNNILTYYQINDKRRQADYIGPDIDTGFRSAHFTSSNRMVISFDIACILMYSQKNLKAQGGLTSFVFSKYIHIMSYRVLKGVWNGIPYPILFYHGDSSETFEASITEREKNTVIVIQEYLDSQEKQPKNILPEYNCYQEQLLKQLCQKMELEFRIQHLIDLMNQMGLMSIQTVKI